uniref:Uncharacterized protein n=1 Tax=Chaetoceros debilis TaxID=122233 RepID=A0A7S3PXH6_9STRA
METILSFDSLPYFQHQVALSQFKASGSRTVSSFFCTESIDLTSAGDACFLNDDTAPFSLFVTQLNVTELDCIDVNGDWKAYSCEEAQSIYHNISAEALVETQGSERYDKLLSEWEISCCVVNEEKSMPPSLSEIRDSWWNDRKDFREGDAKNLGISKGCMAILSVLCSSILLWMILRSHDGLSTTQHRLLVGLCFADIVYSLSQSHFGMAVPKELDYAIWNARGNMATCQTQGFLDAFGALCGPFYNASLCLYYLAAVKYEKTEEYIRTKIEPFLHAVPLLVAISYAIFRLASDSLNPQQSGFCTGPLHSPPHCVDEEVGFVIEGLFEIPCGRGPSSTTGLKFIGYLTLAILFCPPIIMLASLTLIYRTVKKLENKVSKYGASAYRSNIQSRASTVSKTTSDTVSDTKGCWQSMKRSIESSVIMRHHIGTQKANSASVRRKKSTNSTRSQSRSVLYKGMAYSCSWLLTWGFWFTWFIYFFVLGQKETPIAIIYLINIFLPLQGVYNLVIFMHPKVLSAKRSKRDKLSWRQSFVKAFWSRGTQRKKNKERNLSGGEPINSRLRSIRKGEERNSKSDKSAGIVLEKSSANLRSKNKSSQDVSYLSFGRRPRTYGKSSPVLAKTILNAEKTYCTETDIENAGTLRHHSKNASSNDVEDNDEPVLSGTLAGEEPRVSSLFEPENTAAPTAIHTSHDSIKDGEAETCIENASNDKHHSTKTSSKDAENYEGPSLSTSLSRENNYVPPLFEPPENTGISTESEKTKDFLKRGEIVDDFLLDCDEF